MSIVKDEVTRLSRLVNTFLDITRMQSDKVNIVKSDFDINEVIRLIIIGLGPKIDKKNLNIITVHLGNGSSIAAIKMSELTLIR